MRRQLLSGSVLCLPTGGGLGIGGTGRSKALRKGMSLLEAEWLMRLNEEGDFMVLMRLLADAMLSNTVQQELMKKGRVKCLAAPSGFRSAKTPLTPKRRKSTVRPCAVEAPIKP